MAGTEDSANDNPHTVDEEQMDEMADQLERISEIGTGLVSLAVRDAAAESGRRPVEQWKRMGDHFAYMAVAQDPNQKQLDDYALSGDTVEVQP